MAEEHESGQPYDAPPDFFAEVPAIDPPPKVPRDEPAPEVPDYAGDPVLGPDNPPQAWLP